MSGSQRATVPVASQPNVRQQMRMRAGPRLPASGNVGSSCAMKVFWFVLYGGCFIFFSFILRQTARLDLSTKKTFLSKIFHFKCLLNVMST